MKQGFSQFLCNSFGMPEEKYETGCLKNQPEFNYRCRQCPYSAGLEYKPQDCMFYRSGTPLDDMRRNNDNCLFCGDEIKTKGQGIVEIYSPKCGFIYYRGLS